MTAAKTETATKAAGIAVPVTATLTVARPPVWLDTLERVGWTFAQAFLAVEMASGAGWYNAGVAKAAGIAGGAAVISFLKNLSVNATAR